METGYDIIVVDPIDFFSIDRIVSMYFLEQLAFLLPKSLKFLPCFPF